MQNFMLGMLFFSFLRLVFLSWNWPLFSEQASLDIAKAFLVGFRFDLSALATLSLPSFLISVYPRRSPQMRLLVWLSFWLLNWPLFIFNWGDIEFVNFMGRRFTIDNLYLISEMQGKTSSIFSTYIVLSALCFVTLIVFPWSSYKQSLIEKFGDRGDRRHSLWVRLLGFVLLIISARGGLQLKPLGFANAQVFSAPVLNHLVLNSSFTMLKSIGRESLSRKMWLEAGEEPESLLNGSIATPTWSHEIPKSKNVVLIVLEGFGQEVLGREGFSEGYTPFLTELSKKSLVVPYFFSNGRRSIEGIAAILTGIPAMMAEPFITSQFQTNLFWGMGSAFAESGFDTSFFHGATNGTMFFDSFTKSAGIQKYFGLTEYPHRGDHDGTWGIFDGPYLQYAAQEIGNLKRPFFSMIFTLSSHHPYRVPDKFLGKFKKGNHPIFESIGYADTSLKEFFESAQKADWYNDTIFLITADHTSANEDPYFNNEIGKYRVPFILYQPTMNETLRARMQSKLDDKIACQIDIMPTLVDLFELPVKAKNYLGQSVFVDGDRVCTFYLDGHYQIVANDWALDWSENGGARLFDWKAQNPKWLDLATSPVSQDAEQSLGRRKNELEKKLKAHIDYFGRGMWDNKLYFPNR
jgi:phosphoglycerol transferase MdoB-like AlkP superfamily enzyme